MVERIDPRLSRQADAAVMAESTEEPDNLWGLTDADARLRARPDWSGPMAPIAGHHCCVASSANAGG